MRIKSRHLGAVTLALALGIPGYASSSQTIIGGTGGPAGAVNGIALNSDRSRLYGVSTADDRLFVLDAHTGSTLAVFGAANGIFAPDDVVVSSTGDIYMSDTLAGFVVKLPAGAGPFTQVVRLPAPPNTPLFAPLINSIVLSDDETHLYAGVCSNPQIPNLLYDFNLASNTASVVEGPDHQPLTFGLGCSIGGITYSNGYLYGAQLVDGTIYRVGPFDQARVSPQAHVVVAGNGASSQVQCPGNTPPLVNPGAVELDSEGRLYISDSYDNTLSRVTKPDKVCQTPVSIATLPGGFGLPGTGIDSIAIDRSTDRILVSSSADGYIVEVTVDKSTGTIGPYLKTPGLVLPLGVAVPGDGNVYVGDFNSLRTVDPVEQRVTHSVAETIAGFLGGSTNPLVPNPVSVVSPFSLAKFGNILVVGNLLDRYIQLWDPHDNSVVANINARLLAVSPTFAYGTPVNVIEYRSPGDTESSIVAAHFNSGGPNDPFSPNARGYLIKYSGSATGYTTLTKLGPGVPGFAGGYPAPFSGLATDGTNYWVASYAGVISSFDDNGPGAPVLSGLVFPQGLAYFDNHLYVVELGSAALGAPSKLSSIDLTTHTKRVIESPIPVGSTNPAVGLLLLSSVAADPNTGDLYYTGEAGRVLNTIPRSVVAGIED